MNKICLRGIWKTIYLGWKKCSSHKNVRRVIAGQQKSTKINPSLAITFFHRHLFQEYSRVRRHVKYYLETSYKPTDSKYKIQDRIVHACRRKIPTAGNSGPSLTHNILSPTISFNHELLPKKRLYFSNFPDLSKIPERLPSSCIHAKKVIVSNDIFHPVRDSNPLEHMWQSRSKSVFQMTHRRETARKKNPRRPGISEREKKRVYGPAQIRAALRCVQEMWKKSVSRK